MTELPTDTCPLAYVSMSSAPDLDLVYVKVVRPVLEYAGFSCRRGSGESIIIADALDKIDEVDLIVCDLTHNRPQAFYDLGIAHAFRKKTIIMSQETAEIPFDTRYQRAVAYKDDRFSLIELRETFLSALKFMFPEGATTSPSEAQVEQIAPISISELDSARVAISHENSDARRYALRVLGDHRDGRII